MIAVLSFVLLISLAACGSGSNSKGNNANDGTAGGNETKTIELTLWDRSVGNTTHRPN